MVDGDRRPSIEQVYGTLPDWAIREYIEQGVIKIDPLPENWRENLGQVTIDFHMGTKILVPDLEKIKFIDVREGVKPEDYHQRSLEIGEPYLIAVNQFILAETTEHLQLPDNMIGRLEGRSSLARIGLVIHLTSGRF